MRHHIVSYLIIAGCAMAFSSKGIIAKYAYPHGVTPLQILGLRMIFALPVYALVMWLMFRKREPLGRATHARLMALGFVSYYLAAVLDFHGLALMSAGLERMVLQSYPIVLVVLSLVFLKTRYGAGVWCALIATSTGIVMSYAGEASLEGSNPGLGSLLIFASASIYAAYILLAKPVIGALGAARFITISMLYSSVFMLAHVFAVEG
ncbi:MAG: DMT family transporter, partial [Planctomycetota bacterium]